jgi:non-specific serine/threonine protein kinase/serine/threonine-protein kinase
MANGEGMASARDHARGKMMPSDATRWDRVKELFEVAVDLPPEERAVLLDNECAGDDELRREVHSLLASDNDTEDFIEQPAFALPRDLFPKPAEERVSGRQIGAYKIIRELGRGGLGAVYLAARADDEYRKEVAIKLVRRGLDTDDILRRFRNERQILAQLDHPNVARLIDGGTTDDGLPYFVMEYVKGEPIGAYCNAHALTTADRLNLFRKVCAAVTYAHQNLVIHRDLKPSNILVTHEGEPKLLDFGIAKLLGAEEDVLAQTMTGQQLMTPEYASPEQVKGEKITTASDVYSLGVFLYELLTGQRPYRLKTRTAEEIAHAITEQEPDRPSTLVAQAYKNSKIEIRKSKILQGDLDNIVLKAMRKEPARRYASVAQFSDDIRRHLEGLPVIARKDTLRYRSGKFIRRHKLGVAAALVVFLTLIGGLIATFWEARRATAQRDRAERRFADVRKLSNALLFDIAPKIERLEGSTDARHSLVQRALEYLDSLAHESTGDSHLQSELAAAYEKVGELQGAPRKPNLSDYAGAIASYDKARAIRKHLREKYPNDLDNLRRLAGDLSALSSIRWWTSDMSGSLEDSQTALAAYATLLTQQPDSIDLQLAAAESRIDLAAIFYFNEQLAAAYPPLRQAITGLELLRKRDPDNIEILRLLGRGHTLLSMTLSWDGKQKEGEAEMAQAFAIYEPLAEKHPQDSVIRQGLLEMYLQSSQLFEDADPARSFEILLKARDVAEKATTSDAANVQARQNLAKTDSRLGVIALHLGKAQDAIIYLEKSLITLGQLEKLDPSRKTYRNDIGRVLMFLGQAKHLQRAFDDALAAYAQAVATFEDIARADPQNNQPVRKLATVYQCIGDVHHDVAGATAGALHQSHLQTATENYRRALDILLVLQAKKALAEYDLKYLEDLRAVVSKLESE